MLVNYSYILSPPPVFDSYFCSVYPYPYTINILLYVITVTLLHLHKDKLPTYYVFISLYLVHVLICPDKWDVWNPVFDPRTVQPVASRCIV
jgi:hypothetical protein